MENSSTSINGDFGEDGKTDPHPDTEDIVNWNLEICRINKVDSEYYMDFPKCRPYNNNDIIGREELPRISAKSDQQRQRERLELYEFVEQEVSGEGNCQFRSISDQIYGSCEHHKLVREQAVKQLNFYGELYEGFVPMEEYDEYLKRMSNCGEWGDNVTLQAAADSYGVKILVITSFKDTDYIEILPQSDCDHKSNKMIYLSFCAGETYMWA
ncbi:hypothetical protein H5410_053583 [Solanum commersonii]|uniref:OTU domain-containing protein n=1 Tax=Solanum commersonii TaxID=4109 RepID=A0A9J5X6R6_SOLCO|nr:hypothetical protein H5410_053583 [Solanum commersonii]